MPSELQHVATDDPNRLTLDERAASVAHQRERVRLSAAIDDVLQSANLGRYSVQPEPLMLNPALLESPTALLARMAGLTPPWTLDEKQRMLDEMVRHGVISNRFAAQCLVLLGVPTAMVDAPSGELHSMTTLDDRLSQVERRKRTSKRRAK